MAHFLQQQLASCQLRIANCHHVRSTHSFLLATAGGRQEEEVQVDLIKPQVSWAHGAWEAAPLQHLHGPGHSLLLTPPPPHCCMPDPLSQ